MDVTTAGAENIKIDSGMFERAAVKPKLVLTESKEDRAKRRQANRATMRAPHLKKLAARRHAKTKMGDLSRKINRK